jgi:hypothetical protein
MGADIHVTGDVLAQATTGPLADEIAQSQGAQTPGAAATKGAVLRTIDESLAIALQGMAMAIAMHAIAPMTKPLFAELEGSAYAFTSKLKANNRMQEALSAQAEALQGARDFAQAQEHVAKEKRWLEERLRLLDEIEAAARKENEPGAARPKGGGIAAKIKMSAEDLSALRTDLQGKLDGLQQGTLPLATSRRARGCSRARASTSGRWCRPSARSRRPRSIRGRR